MWETEEVNSDPRASVGPMRLREAGAELLAVAAVAKDGRATRTLTLPSAHPLRQRLVALLEGREVRDPRCRGSVTLHVLAGQIRCTTPHGAWDVATGAWSALPPGPWAVSARTDAVLLQTTHCAALDDSDAVPQAVGACGS